MPPITTNPVLRRCLCGRVSLGRLPIVGSTWGRVNVHRVRVHHSVLEIYMWLRCYVRRYNGSWKKLLR